MYIFLYIFTESLFLSDPEFTENIPPEYLSHEERYTIAVKRAFNMMHKVNEDDTVQKLAGQMEGIK